MVVRAIVLVVVVAAALPATASAAIIKVNTTQDQFGTDAAHCSLREAIQAANNDHAFGGCPAGHGADTIVLKGGHDYVRTLSGPGDTNAAGELAIASPITITVNGKHPAKIDARELYRVFQVMPGARLTASKLIIEEGAAVDATTGYEGGGIYNQGTLRLTNSTVTDNQAPGNGGCACGGGISSDPATSTTLNRVRVIYNQVGNEGGGIIFQGGALTVARSTIAHNIAGGVGGGGIALEIGAKSDHMTLSASTIDDNASTEGPPNNAGGGGIFVGNYYGATLKATNVTITGNSSSSYGGGIFDYTGAISLNAATITRNVVKKSMSGYDGGGINGSEISTSNSIIARNIDQNSAAYADCDGTLGTDHNLVGKNTGCFQGKPNIVTQYPHLGKLANNGGPTQTIALLMGSPAIDHADKKTAPKYDQRGVKRGSKPDIGAFQLLP